LGPHGDVSSSKDLSAPLGYPISAPSSRAVGATRVPAGLQARLEDIVSKRLTAPYRSGVSKDWIKVKNPNSPAMVWAREGRW
jgi:hypothetical protein